MDRAAQSEGRKQATTGELCVCVKSNDERGQTLMDGELSRLACGKTGQAVAPS
jgi:hypothetical protein